jgi:hypothetical protein
MITWRKRSKEQRAKSKEQGAGTEEEGRKKYRTSRTSQRARRDQLSVLACRGESCSVKGSSSRDETFLEMIKANFIAAREIVIEFVF